MCFSAEASFAGGLIISSIGVATLNRVQKPSHKLFAGIPLFFGIQQITEGFLWVTLPVPDFVNIQKICAYIFLIMALVIWPTMIPLAVTRMEEDESRKKILKIFFYLGIAVTSYYTFCLLRFNIDPQVNCYHILYKNNFPRRLSNPLFMVYLIVTITPLFLSGMRGSKVMGLMMMASCIISAIFFTEFLTSVWCFFAALISCVVYWIIREYEKVSGTAQLEELQMG